MSTWHETHKEQIRIYAREYNKRRAKPSKEYRASVMRKHRSSKKGMIGRLFEGAKSRAKRKGMIFSITKDDINIPDICPLLKIPLYVSNISGKYCPNSPSLDRKDSKLGYIKGNVWVISLRANVMKNDATLEEHELLVANWRSICQST